MLLLPLVMVMLMLMVMAMAIGLAQAIVYALLKNEKQSHTNTYTSLICVVIAQSYC